jgi:hypothetical protein
MAPPGGMAPPGAPVAPPVEQMSGLHVEGRPRAHVQRRQYAAAEQTDVSDANGAADLRTPAPNAPSAPAPHAGASNGNSGSGSASSRIDPSQIPRPDAAKRAESFPTRANAGQSPPPATSAYLVDDDGNCSPRYMRLTLNQVSTTADGLTQCGVPLAVVCQPFADVPAAEGSVPVVDFGQQVSSLDLPLDMT